MNGYKRINDPEKLLWGIIVVAVLLRIGSALLLGNTIEALPGIFDQISYHTLALRVLDGHGFTFGENWWPATAANAPTAHWSYLYTLYLIVVYSLFGPNPLVARLIQAIAVGILMPWLVYRIAGRLFSPGTSIRPDGLNDSVKIGLISATIVAIYVYFFYYAAALITESFYIVGILWTLDLALEISQSAETRWRPWLLLGLAIGITVLLRQLFLLFFPFLMLWLWWVARPKISRLILPAVILLIMMLPWMVRNYSAFDQFVLLNTNSGYAFFWGNHPVHGTKFIPILPPGVYSSLIPEELRQKNLNEAALDTALLKRGIGFVIEDPVRYTLLSLSRIPPYFIFWPSPQSGPISNISRVASFGLFLPFMLYGLFCSFQHRFHLLKERIASPFFLFYLFIIVYTGIHVLTWTLVRYRLPIDAVLIVFAGLGIAQIAEKVEKRRQLKMCNWRLFVLVAGLAGLVMLVFPPVAFAVQVSELPEGNLVQNPWFRSTDRPDKAGLDYWIDAAGPDVHWLASQKIANPAPDDIASPRCGGQPYCGTAARFGKAPGGRGIDPANEDAYLYQVVVADSSKRKLRFFTHWVTDNLAEAKITVYGSDSPDGPWTPVWVPLSVTPETGSGRDWTETGFMETVIVQGYGHYKIEFFVRFLPGGSGAKFTGVYFNVADADSGAFLQPMATPTVAPGRELIVAAPESVATAEKSAGNDGVEPSQDVEAEHAVMAATGTPAVVSMNLAAVPVASSQIDLRWSDNFENERGFKIERSQDGRTDWVEIAKVSESVTTYSDAPLNPATRYFYRIRVSTTTGQSFYSDVTSAETKAFLPAPASESRSEELTQAEENLDNRVTSRSLAWSILWVSLGAIAFLAVARIVIHRRGEPGEVRDGH